MRHSLNGRNTQEAASSDCHWTEGYGTAGGPHEKMTSFLTDICPYAKMTLQSHIFSNMQYSG